jgi:hypothetical protein
MSVVLRIIKTVLLTSRLIECRLPFGYVQRSIASTVSPGLVLKHSFEDDGGDAF